MSVIVANCHLYHRIEILKNWTLHLDSLLAEKMRILGPLGLLHPIDKERKKNIKDNQFLQYFKITRITRIFRSEPNKLKGLSFCKNNNFFLKYIIHAISPPPKLSIIYKKEMPISILQIFCFSLAKNLILSKVRYIPHVHQTFQK